MATSSTASSLQSFAHRYLCRVMAHSFVSGGRSDHVFGRRSFFYIHCMTTCIPMHLGHACYIYSSSRSIARRGHLYEEDHMSRGLSRVSSPCILSTTPFLSGASGYFSHETQTTKCCQGMTRIVISCGE